MYSKIMVIRFIICSVLLLFVQAAKAEDEVQCHQLNVYDAAKNPIGDIYSPFYKEKKKYPNNLWCEYSITAPEGHSLKLTFKDLDIDPSVGCGQDSLTIFDNNPNLEGSKIAVLCGTDKPLPIISDIGKTMFHFLFRTDNMGTGRGFHIQYEASPYLEYCPKLKMCRNTRCFKDSQKCDGIDDCGDGTDEEGCTPGNNRIVEDQEAIQRNWTRQVSLQDRNHTLNHTCGGSLTNPQWIETVWHFITGSTFTESEKRSKKARNRFSSGSSRSRLR